MIAYSSLRAVMIASEPPNYLIMHNLHEILMFSVRFEITFEIKNSQSCPGPVLTTS